jgi:hypothetical protein
MKYGQTAHNRTVTASPPSAARATQNTSRGFAPLWCFAPPQFCVCEKLLRSFLIAKAKTSVTWERYATRWQNLPEIKFPKFI